MSHYLLATLSPILIIFSGSPVFAQATPAAQQPTSVQTIKTPNQSQKLTTHDNGYTYESSVSISKGGWTEEFQKVDTNKDGSISKEESWAATGSALAIADANKDGSISSSEAANTSKITPKSPQEAQAIANFGMLYGFVLPQIDTNKDGTASRTELAAFSDKTFLASDTNRDGKLDLKEYACQGMPDCVIPE